MAPPTVLPMDFAPFFDAICAQLVKFAVVPDLSLIIPTATDDVPHYAADRDILLWPQEETSDPDTMDGGGRFDTRSHAMLFVVARSRLELDDAVSDRQKLIHASLGHYAFRAAIRNALHLFWPQDRSKNALGVQPMRWLGTHRPVKNVDARGWLSSILEIAIVYKVAFEPVRFVG